VLALLVSPLVILGFSAVAVVLPQGIAGLTTGANNLGPHGLTDILYAFTSTNANNGSAFAGLNGDRLALVHHRLCQLR
jgi:potassium-transporting ATPase potassium-binding subunit